MDVKTLSIIFGILINMWIWYRVGYNHGADAGYRVGVREALDKIKEHFLGDEDI